MTRAELLASCRRGILFSTPMVQAIYSDQKTRTMRVMNPQPALSDFYGIPAYEFKGHYYFNDEGPYIARKHFAHDWAMLKPGDIVYVRETWQYLEGAIGHGYAYKAGGGVFNDLGEWRPSIFMPKAAARGFLRITGVRVQRPQELTAKEIFAEGVSCGSQDVCGVLCGMCANGPQEMWRKLWDDINFKRGYGWGVNPWCFTYLVERVVPDDQ